MGARGRGGKEADGAPSCMRRLRSMPLAAHASASLVGCSWLTSPVRKLSAVPWSTRSGKGAPLYALISSTASCALPASTEPR